MTALRQGTEMQNVFATSDDPPSLQAKDAVHGNTKNCSFCNKGLYEGLLHVAKLSDVQSGDGRSSITVYLVPGCQSCNRKYSSTLTLKRDVAQVSTTEAGARVKKFAILR